jgi:CCR4-NOT transcription complex subunit 1
MLLRPPRLSLQHRARTEDEVLGTLTTLRHSLVTAMAGALAQANSLAGVMEEAGYACTANDGALQEVLHHFPAPTEQTVAEVLGMVARTSELRDSTSPTAGGGATGILGGRDKWNIGILIDALGRANPALNWQRVAELLDQPGFHVPDQPAFRTLMAAYRRGTPDPFPLHAVVGGLWKNAPGQLSFLMQAIAAAPETFAWDHASARMEPIEGLHGGKAPTGTANHAWMCLDLYRTLASLADSGHAPAVRHIMEHPLKACPEVMLLGVAHFDGSWGPLQQEVCDALLITYITNHPNSSVVMGRLWPHETSRRALMRAMVALYDKDASNIARVLDVTQVGGFAHLFFFWGGDGGGLEGVSGVVFLSLYESAFSRVKP